MRKLRFVSGWIFVLCLAMPGLLGAASPGGPAGSPETLKQRLEALDRKIQAHLRRVAGQATAGRSADPDLLDDAEGLRRQLEALERAAREEQAPPAYEAKLRQLGLLVGNLEKSGREGASVGVLPSHGLRPVASTSPFTALAVPANDDCINALAVGFGSYSGDTSGATNDAPASCGASLFSPDVWFQYTPASYGYVSVDTFGSAYDTVLSVYTGCPATTTNEWVCNDDAFGLQSALSFYAYPGEQYWIRVSGFDGAGGSFQLHLGEGGTISGTVTEAATGDPLPDGRVEVLSSGGYYRGSAWTGAAGEYMVTGLSAGSYYVVTDGFDGFLDELYDDVPCLRGYPTGCSLASGTPVPVVSTGGAGGIDIALSRGGSIGGTVTRSVGGTPIENVRIETYNANGTQVATDYTAADGTYLVEGLAGGNYFVVAEDSLFLSELFDDVACLGGATYGCDPTTGTPVLVALGVTTGGIDFALEDLGSISGVITSLGAPAPSVQVEILKQSGSDFYYVNYTYTDSTGTYTFAGLPPGTYAVRTGDYTTYVNEVYDDVASLSAATLIPVALNDAVTGIDFDLDRRGKISGTVTDAVTGDPVSGVDVEIRTPTGGWVDWAYTDSSGHYTSDGLSSGTYAVHTDIYYTSAGYLNELYQELPCPGGTCDPSSGTPVAVAVNTTATGIDFTLDVGGVISGTVTDATSAAAIAYYGVAVFDSTGSRVAGDYTNSMGQYRVNRLLPGTYYVATDDNYRGFFDELYDNLPCEPSCDATAGTPIVVGIGEEMTGVDFALDQLGSISGTLTDSAGSPITYYDVDVYDEMGNWVADSETDSTGAYRVPGLQAGTYYVTTGGYYYRGFSDELYDGFSCEPSCDPTAGTPVAVVHKQETSGIDFVLGRFASVTGWVFDEDTGEPLSDIELEARSADGSQWYYGYTDSAGKFSFDGLPPGTCYVATSGAYYRGYLDELFSDIPCYQGYGCDPTKGSPVPTFLDTTTENVSFALRTSGSTPRGTGGLQGTVEDTVLGVPLLGVLVDVWDGGGSHVATVVSDAAGRYDVSLAPGSYFVSTDNRRGFVDEVYNGVLCPGGGCDPTLGTAVPVGGGMATGIDFALAGKWEIFADGFESGDVSRWSSAVGNVP